MAPSVFDGRTPATVTEYEYDDAGRLVRAVSQTEPLWTELDQAEMLALAAYRATLCPLHGGPLAECTTAEDDGPDYRVSTLRCRAQDAILIEQETGNRLRPGAILWSVAPQRARHNHS